MEAALYGPYGFYTTSAPGGHFRTSANASDLFADAVLCVLERTDDALGRPDPLHLVDVGAGRGELLCRLSTTAPRSLRQRLRLRAVERSARPADLPSMIEWTDQLPPPRSVTGMLIATEWLDNIPLDIAEVDDAGTARYVLVDTASGAQTLGAPIGRPDDEWVARWHGDQPWSAGVRFELGGPRDAAWAGAVATLDRGLALTVDYGHTRDNRPRYGTLAAFRGGREVPPIPDGSCDLTAHVAMDAVRHAGERIAGTAARLATQRASLTGLGLESTRPSPALARSDPSGYVRALAAATDAADLLSLDGLGGHCWLWQPIGSAIALGWDTEGHAA
jgi:SAM-dependent MidA family methyltransferase